MNMDIQNICKPIFAFDIKSDGAAQKIIEPWPTIDVAPEYAYRWLHLDLAEASTALWLKDHLDEHAAAALLQKETRPFFEQTASGMILNLRAVNLNLGQDPDDMVSLRLWATPNCLITVRLRKIFSIDDIRVRCENGNAPIDVGEALVSICRGISQRMETISVELDEETEHLEEIILENTLESGSSLLSTRINVTRLRRFFSPQSEAIGSFLESEVSLLNEQQQTSLGRIENSIIRSVETLNSVKDRLTILQEQTVTLETEKINRNSYILSIAAAVFLPLGFLTGLLGVNVGGIPGSENPYAFMYLCISMVVLGFAITIFLQKSRWF